MNDLCEYVCECGYGLYYVGCSNDAKRTCPMYNYIAYEKERQMQEKIEKFWRGE